MTGQNKDAVDKQNQLLQMQRLQNEKAQGEGTAQTTQQQMLQNMNQMQSINSNVHQIQFNKMIGQ